MPTIVIHGRTDPLIRPTAAHALAAAIPNAQLTIFPAMGHQLPAALTDQITTLATRNAEGTSWAFR